MINANKTKRQSKVEFALLQLISENGELSGYEINKLIEERGYREWADIGETSIYSGLDKLNNKELVEYYIYADKKGRGPLPKKFKLTNKGRETLKNEILEALSNTRERDRRFDLALASIPLLAPEEATAALNKRKGFLAGESERLKNKLESQGGDHLPFHVKALFKHPLVFIDTEIAFIDELIVTLNGGSRHE